MSLTIAAQLAQIPAHHLNIMGYVDESAVGARGGLACCPLPSEAEN